MQQDAPVLATPAPAPAAPAPDAPARREAADNANAVAAPAAEARTGRMAPRAAPNAPAAKAIAPYAQWLVDIEALLARGDEAKARSELAKLLERYPEARAALPDKLRPLAPAP